MTANQPFRRRGRPRTKPDNLGTARGELSAWLREVVSREPVMLNGDIVAESGISEARVGRAMRGTTFPAPGIVEAVTVRGALTPAERLAFQPWVDKLREIDKRQGKGSAEEIPPRPWESSEHGSSDDSTEDPPEQRYWLSARKMALTLVELASVALVIGGLLTYFAIEQGPPSETRAEQVAARLGAASFTDPREGAGETGPRIPPSAVVEVSCKVYAPIFTSTQPDGYWYRIASPPWNNKYYAVANVFANGDQPGTVPPTNTDYSVPDC